MQLLAQSLGRLREIIFPAISAALGTGEIPITQTLKKNVHLASTNENFALNRKYFFLITSCQNIENLRQVETN